MMAAHLSHTDVVCLNSTPDSAPPSCPHGPALLFERFISSTKEVKQFFACSAFRDRKECSFFKWADSMKKSREEMETKKSENEDSHKSQRKRYFAFKKLSISDRNICCNCGLLLLPGEISLHECQGHMIKRKVKLKELKQPSYIFIPHENNKTFAQYLFSQQSVDFIFKSLQDRFSHVLCIGTPRLHEKIQSLSKERKTDLKSFLLDLDNRYGQFYSPKQFARFNMFNHHFFEDEEFINMSTFLQKGANKVVFVIDPPFGGMIEPLALTLSRLSSLTKKDPVNSTSLYNSDEKSCNTPFLLFLPYFMEKRVLESLYSATMLDYKVEYDNHDLYKNMKRKGSPVRIFVHSSLSSLPLPTDQGYWWCDLCQRFSASENVHCNECRSCTSKDGSTYVHCDMCNRCVKPSRKHCFTCDSCQAQDHVCNNTITPTGCFICGDLNHKKRDCPDKSRQSRKRLMKRKSGEVGQPVRKKMLLT